MIQREDEVVLLSEPQGGHSVLAPDLPSVATEGETVEDALAMAKEAIELHGETMDEDGFRFRRCNAAGSPSTGERAAPDNHRARARLGFVP